MKNEFFSFLGYQMIALKIIQMSHSNNGGPFQSDEKAIKALVRQKWQESIEGGYRVSHGKLGFLN